MALTESQPSDLEDPLVNLTGASLFRTSLPPQHSNNDEALRYPNKLLEQAKKIVARGSDVLNSEITSNVVSVNKSEALTDKGNERPRERRRELGRKRAPFSLKLETRQHTDTASLEMKFDPSKYAEPEEFFAALDKIENAQKEIQKQTGAVLADQYHNNISRQTRRDRQVHLRRPVHYRHMYPSSMPETETIHTSEETPLSDGLIPTFASSQQETIQPEDVVASAEDEPQNILDELLSHSGEDLDDHRTVTLLQEHLQLKPVNIGNLGLPDLRAVRRSDMKAPGGNILKRKSILADTQHLFKRMSSKTSANHRQKGESSSHNAASPGPSGSPLAPISILYRRLSHSSQSSDPFSLEAIDQAPKSKSSFIEEITEQSEQVAIEADGDRVGEPAADSTPGVRVIEDFTKTVNKVLNDDPAGLAVGSSSNGCQADLGDSAVNDFEESLENVNSKRSDADQNDITKGCTEANKELASTLPEFSLTETNVEESESNHQPDKSHVGSLDRSEEQISKIGAVLGTEQLVKNNRSPNNNGAGQLTKSELKGKQDKEKVNAGKRRKTKQNSRRQSLAAVGTSWKDGVRRSTRRRTRPLEYWRGERFLYGRVHASLTTVIGVKYVNAKVESYISDEYKDLLEKAALH